MMRLTVPSLALALLALASLPAADAGGEGCIETNPCLWLVDLDANGIASISQENFTQGDWFQLSVYNDDDQDHTLTLEGYGLELDVPALDFGESEAFQFDTAGTFSLTDSPTGDSAEVLVIEGDVVDYEEDSDPGRETDDGDGGKGSPSVGLVALGVGLLAAAAFTARRGQD